MAARAHARPVFVLGRRRGQACRLTAAEPTNGEALVDVRGSAGDGVAADRPVDMRLECQLATNGIFCGDGTGYRDPRLEALRPGAADWRLLLQIDSEDGVDMMWRNVGRIFNWIKHADLPDRNGNSAGSPSSATVVNA
jgi:Domain of unknown function (DUF1963)